MDFDIRRGGIADVDEIAAAHLDSICSLGPRYYNADIVSDWGAQINGALYANAIARGEQFFIAVGQLSDKPEVLGFSTHRTDADTHGTAVYVRGRAARLGVGSALFRAAEAAAIEEVGHAEHQMWSGRPMPCVFMRKKLAAD